jgi:hypothetical protein
MIWLSIVLRRGPQLMIARPPFPLTISAISLALICLARPFLENMAAWNWGHTEEMYLRFGS